MSEIERLARAGMEACEMLGIADAEAVVRAILSAMGEPVWTSEPAWVHWKLIVPQFGAVRLA